jgi:hypothetical protein
MINPSTFLRCALLADAIFSGFSALPGELMVVAQAIATGLFAELQYLGLRKSGSGVAA